MARSIKKIAIIGSGPSGAIAADFILKNSSIKIDLIDAGITSFSKIKIKSRDIIPKKTLFGNAFVYERIDNKKFCFDSKTSFDTSHAKGGLSNVWGANISSLHNKYLTKWRIDKKEFNKALQYVLKRIPICAQKDMIDDQYDISISNKHIILDGISFEHTQFNENERENLYKNNLAIGASKLAIDTKLCIRCEKCMDGCKVNAIFNAANLLGELESSLKFKYKPNYIFDKFVENKNSVTIFIFNTKTEKTEAHTYDAIIIATGVIDTTSIVRKSLNLSSNYIVKESKKYYLPFISTKLFTRLKTSGDLALSHIFVQNLKKSSMVHCQLYSSFHILEYILKNKIGSFSSLILIPFKFLLKYIYVGMVYLDSEDSRSFSVNEQGSKGIVKGTESIKSKKRLKSFLYDMRKAIRFSHFIPIPLILGSKLGHSQHFGGTLPMKKNPKIYEVDMMGRPYHHKRTFIIDSSVLPSIPALPTTITVMANAVRICAAIIAV